MKPFEKIDTNFKLTNGLKAIDPWDVDANPEAWVGLNTFKGSVLALVPAVQSAWQARCKAISDLPFTIYKGEQEIDNSDGYKNVAGFMPNPRYFLWMTEAALVGYGQAYWFKQANVYKYVKGAQYLLPSSIKCNWNERGIQGFERNTGKKTEHYEPKDILYFWTPDPAVEFGPPTVWPLRAADISANALERINVFVKEYMERGAVKAMLLAAKTMPTKEEAERVENWFNKFMRGVNNLRWKVFNAEAITPTIVGEGLEAFKGITIIDDLTRQIHTAMGTRHMLEDENYATADVRQREFYTNTIVPEARIIGDALNNQILGPLGYRIEFNPERLEVFADDESDNMAAFGTLSSSLTNSSPEVIELSLSLAGVVLTDEQQKMLNAMKAQKEANKQKLEEQLNKPKNEPPAPIDEQPEDDKMQQDMAKWMRKAAKHIGKDVQFLSDAIAECEQARIHAGLPGCKCEDDIKALFEPRVTDTVAPVYERPDYTALIEAMKLEVQAIKSQPTPQPITVNNYLPEAKPVVNVAAQEPATVTVTVPDQPAPVVNVTNEIKADKPDEARDVVKAIRKLAREK